ncbi:EAL and HDOD domain-containing protein, partial [Paraglaciecola sp.]|uniref:EAL and HDOD domain-containing protein n=1 Tax=Paraglaciecola sp. TaxID=1920173 RepID=UPI003EF8BCBC
EYQHAISLGCEYFQGYFFSRPEVIKSVSFNPAQMSVINLMSEMNKSEPNINAVTSIFEAEVNLSFKLLRYLQSPIFKRIKKIETIKQATVILGNEELKRFVSLLFTAQFSENKPEQLTVMSLARARFCELMVQTHILKGIESSAFLVGLLSLIDALVDGDIKELMNILPISNEIKEAIVNRQGASANLLQLCEMYESAEWETIETYCKKMSIDADKTSELFQQALQWASERNKSLQ